MRHVVVMVTTSYPRFPGDGIRQRRQLNVVQIDDDAWRQRRSHALIRKGDADARGALSRQGEMIETDW